MEAMTPAPEPELELEPTDARRIALLGLAVLAGAALLLVAARRLSGARSVSPAHPAAQPLGDELGGAEAHELATYGTVKHLADAMETRLEQQGAQVLELGNKVGELTVRLESFVGAPNVVPRGELDNFAPPAPAHVSTNGGAPLAAEPAEPSAFDEALAERAPEPGGEPVRVQPPATLTEAPQS